MPEVKESVQRLERCNQLINHFEEAVADPIRKPVCSYLTGVDLGTACIVLSVLDENYNPVAGAYRYADVVKDGMVVDFHGAVTIVRELKEEIEEKLGQELFYAAAAIPPGTDLLDGGAVKYVVQGAGFELTGLMDEPTAANAVLNIKNGAIVDIGGGTTGITILRDGKVVLVADEPTGGTHFSLVIAGSYKMDLKQADLYKRDRKNHKELMPILKPVIEKVSSIINYYIKGHDIDEIYLVGGTCCLDGIEELVEKQTGIPTYKPYNPMFVTPLGIAFYCKDIEQIEGRSRIG